MTYHREAMLKARKEYVKAWKEAQAAHDKHKKADSNMAISRAELEKVNIHYLCILNKQMQAKTNSQIKSSQAEDAKNSYALALKKLNDQQNAHYHSLLPQALEVQQHETMQIRNRCSNCE
jgi:hypothetical protein